MSFIEEFINTLGEEEREGYKIILQMEEKYSLEEDPIYKCPFVLEKDGKPLAHEASPHGRLREMIRAVLYSRAGIF